jgi:hypothetical protein
MTTQPSTLIEQTSGEKDHHPVTLSPRHRVSCYPGPVLPSSLTELVAVAQNLGANILEISTDEPVILELAGPATIILAQPADSCAEFIPRHRGTCRSISREREEPECGGTTLLSRG